MTNLDAGNATTGDAGRQRPGPALRGERAGDAVAADQPPGQPATDVDQLYAKLGSPPTPVNFSASSSGGSANPQLLVPSAAPGTWYILVYAASVPSASSFTIKAVGTPIQLSAVAPVGVARGQRGHA